MVRPPQILLEPCQEPNDNYETLHLLRQKKYDDAALAYTRYRLLVRDSFKECNSRLQGIDAYFDVMAPKPKGE